MKSIRTFLGSFPGASAASLMFLPFLALMLGVSNFFVPAAQAASLVSVSDTITDSAPSHSATHVIKYTSVTAATSSGATTIQFEFDPTGQLFDLSSIATSTDITATSSTAGGINIVPTVAACSGSDAHDVTVSTSTGKVIFTICNNNTIQPATYTVTVGNAHQVVNPAVTGSYVIRIDGTQPDTADTRVAIINNVVVTASVATSLTFSILGVNAGVTVNGDPVATSATSTSTTLPFGLLTPNVPKLLAQTLEVGTNANNGFVVTVKENQDLTSSNGATIHLFANGDATTTPIVWQDPSSILDNLATYGHIAVTSDDSDLKADTGNNASNDFTGDKFAGNFNVARPVFAHTGPADGGAGNTQNKGKATVAFKIEIGPLQPAATDYTNTLTYVATPTF